MAYVDHYYLTLDRGRHHRCPNFSIPHPIHHVHPHAHKSGPISAADPALLCPM